jgi:hypothetical protein
VDERLLFRHAESQTSNKFVHQPLIKQMIAFVALVQPDEMVIFQQFVSTKRKNMLIF